MGGDLVIMMKCSRGRVVTDKQNINGIPYKGH